jgi:hypothetical protein
MSWLWNNTKGFFTEKPGTFPEIAILNLNAAEILNGYNFIRASSGHLIGRAQIQKVSDKSMHQIDELGNPAYLVNSEIIYPFRFMVGEIRFKRFFIHELGVFMFKNGIALDIEAGKKWGEGEILAFFMLIIRLMGSSKKAQLSLEEEYREPFLPIFKEAIERILSPDPSALF